MNVNRVGGGGGGGLGFVMFFVSASGLCRRISQPPTSKCLVSNFAKVDGSPSRKKISE